MPLMIIVYFFPIFSNFLNLPALLSLSNFLDMVNAQVLLLTTLFYFTCFCVYFLMHCKKFNKVDFLGHGNYGTSLLKDQTVEKCPMDTIFQITIMKTT